MPTQTAIVLRKPALPSAETFDVWGSFGLAREGFALWGAACTAWVGYLTRLSQATGPAAAFDAQSRFLAESLDLCSQATAHRLKDAGVTAPLLNDA